MTKQINRGKRPGWIRADVIDIVGTQKELVEMNKKIRELGRENGELKKNIVARIPRFLVDINGGKDLRIPFQDNCLGQTSKIVINTNKNNMDFRMTCKNIGNAKANDINIEVKMPKELVIVQNLDKKQLSEENNENYSVTSFERANLANAKVTVFPPYEMAYQEYIKDNHIFIKLKDLIHTRIYTSNEYMLIAMKKGVFEMEVNIICEELETKDIQFFKVTVN